jgi:hypothetical protein
LTKEAFVLTALDVAFSRDKRRWVVGVVPAGVLLAWSVWGQISLGGFQGESNNLSLPLTGIIEAAAIWPRGGFEGWFYLIFGLCLVGVAVFLGLIKRGWLRRSLLGWGLFGLRSSWFVWRIGNNAARVFAPILVLIVLHGQLSSEEEEEEESTDRSEPGLDTRVGAPYEPPNEPPCDKPPLSVFMRTGWRRSRIVAALAIVLFAAIQIAIPTSRLVSDSSGRFGWQMYSTASPVPQMVVTTEEGRIEVDVRDYLAGPRNEIDLVRHLPTHLCSVIDGAQRVEWEGDAHTC